MIALTEAAAQKLKGLFEESGVKENKRNLRIKVKGGGCSGFTYELAFDEKKEKDQVFESFGAKVICDPKSYLYLNGSVIDYVEGLMGSGFKLDNPNAKGSCGCGQSFSA